MATPDISQQAFYRDGNAIFDKVFILEKLDYDFTKSGPITVSELNVLGISTFSSDVTFGGDITCLLYTSPSPRDQLGSRMPSSA